MSKPTNFEISKIFDKIAPKYDQVSNPYTYQRRAQVILEHSKGKCLEVGAGTGEISLQLKKAGLSTVACDISKKMVQEIKSKGIKAVVCDAEKLPFKKNTFDTVIASEVIYYLDDPDNFFKEAFRVLKPGGTVLISSADQTAKLQILTRTLLRKLGMSHMYFDDPINTFNTKKEIKSFFKNAGFKKVKMNKIIIFPFQNMNFINTRLEKTFLQSFGIFILASAIKNPK